MKMIIFYVWNESGYYFEVGNAAYPTLKCTGLKRCYKSGFAIDTKTHTVDESLSWNITAKQIANINGGNRCTP